MMAMPPDVTTTTRRRDGDVQAQAQPAARPVRADLLADPLQGLGLAGGADLQMDETRARPGELSEEDAKESLAANKARRLRKRAWQTIATVVGSSEKALTVQLVQDVAAWQKRKGLNVDGRVGNITMQWLALEPGGEKLDALVRGDHTVFEGTIDRGKLNNLQTTLQVITRNFSDTDLSWHSRALADLVKMNRHVMFLRHWKEVSAYAVKKYGAEFKAGYDELGVPMPDFKKLSRTDTLAKIKEFAAAMGKAKTPGPKAGPAYSRMADVLQDLDPSLIPLYR